MSFCRIFAFDIIEVKENESYRVRLYVHNNNPLGEKALSSGTKAYFLLPEGSGKELAVWGLIESDNAIPSEYWDSVIFVSDRSFSLRYVSGTALLENNGIGANGGTTLPDDIANGVPTLIGYSELDGSIPGGYQYACYLTIIVQPVFT